MKKLVLLSFMLTVIWRAPQAQVALYIVAGISPESNPVTAHLLVNRQTPQDEFLFNMTNVKTQYFGGLKARLDLRSAFFLEAEVLYTQRQFNYNMQYTQQVERSPLTVMADSEKKIIMPASIGVKLSLFEVTSGLSVMSTISRQSDLHHIAGFEDHSRSIQFGWHSGLTVNFNQLAVGITYQSALARLCNGMTVNGKSIELRNVPGQCVFKMAYRL